VGSPDPGRPDRSVPETAVSVVSASDREPASAPDPASGREPAYGREPAHGRESALPEQSREDTDAGWGEYPERADDRLYRDRPPHWDDF
jgi:hypothetical protein